MLGLFKRKTKPTILIFYEEGSPNSLQEGEHNRSLLSIQHPDHTVVLLPSNAVYRIEINDESYWYNHRSCDNMTNNENYITLDTNCRSI